MKTLNQLLDLAKREVTQGEMNGRDWQAIVNDILNSKLYEPLFDGLDYEEIGELCHEISHGSDELELELWEKGEIN